MPEFLFNQRHCFTASGAAQESQKMSIDDLIAICDYLHVKHKFEMLELIAFVVYCYKHNLVEAEKV